VWQAGRAGQADRADRRSAVRGEPTGRAVHPPPAVVEVRSDLERVFRAEYPRVVGIARRVLGRGSQAEDVAQEVFLGFARSRVPTPEAPGWLAVAAAHTALNTVRAQRRRLRRESASATPDRVPDVADQVVTEDGRARVRQVLAQLPRRQALALLLRHSGLSYQEIATRLDMPVGSVGTTLRRAEAAARKELGTDESPG
jgi:RNA polymerase sigma factor (sigma-70 family)